MVIIRNRGGYSQPRNNRMRHLINEQNFKLRGSAEFGIMEILRDAGNVKIAAAAINEVFRWIAESFDDGISPTMTFIDKNGAFDVGGITTYTKTEIRISDPESNKRSPYDYPVGNIAKIYHVAWSGKNGYFCIGKPGKPSIYLRDYS